MGKEPSQAELDRLSKQLELRRKELDDDLRALTRVRKMLEQSRNGVVQTHLPLEENKAFADANFNEAVRIAARNTGGMEFTVPDIEATLERNGVRLPNVYPRKRISTVLKDMCERKMIVVVREGHGKQPHVYRTA